MEINEMTFTQLVAEVMDAPDHAFDLSHVFIQHSHIFATKSNDIVLEKIQAKVDLKHDWESMRIKRQLREVVEKLRAGEVLPAGSLNRFKEKFER